jgi:hypothetical protein
MKTINKKEVILKKLFLTDQALQNAENDEFGHGDYAELLEKIVYDQPTPFNIGIFGKWGVGKSTIVNLLKERLKGDIAKNKIKFLEIRVWKYDEDSLRRKFIVKIAEGLGLPIDDIYHDVYYDKEYESALVNIRDIISTILNRKSIALWSLIISFLLWVTFRLINIIGIENQLLNSISIKVEQFITIPLFVSIFMWIVSIIKEAKIKFKIGKYDSQEQFENKFIELVKKDKSKKIIFIDDLDRCSKEKVVKVIETIKTFLDVESCIFIIACDDEIIKKAINKTQELYDEQGNNEGAEYLEKFFQYTLRIPPFMVTDMRKFITNLLNKNGSDLTKLNETLEDIVFITVNNNVKSPRNAITAINEFSSSYILAHKRELSSSSKLHDRKITDNLPILALVTSIRLHFPEFYGDMLRNNDLIFWIKDVLEGNLRQLNIKQLESCMKYYQISEEKSDNKERNPSELDGLINYIDWTQPKNNEYKKLLQFIESTKDYLTIKDISPFLYLGVDTASYLIGDESLQEFNDAMKNGIETKIIKIIEEADESKKEHLFDHMLNWIADKLEGVEQRKALQILSKQLNKCPNNQLHNAAKVFYRKFYKSNLSYDDFKKYSPEGIFISAKNILSTSNQKDLIRQAVNFIGLEGNDINHDKLVLKEVFNNEYLIKEQEYIQKIILFIEKREATNTEEKAITQLIDFDFVKDKIIEYQEYPSVIEKFFSGKIINEVISNLIEIDGDENFDEKNYHDIVQVYGILKRIIIDKNMHLLCESYRELITTRKYYSLILDDIELRQDEIPFDEIFSLSISLLNELENFNDDLGISRILKLCKFWFVKFDQLREDELFANIKEQLIGLSKNENPQIFELGINNYLIFDKYFSDEQNNALLNNYISLINPLIGLDKSNIIRNIITQRKNNLTLENRVTLLSRLADDLNTIDGFENEECYSFWITILESLIDKFEEGELDLLIKPNNPQNILHLNFPNANIGIRNKYCSVIIKNFERISSQKQNEYFELFREYLNTNTKENSEYSINNIYPLRDFLINTTFSSTVLPLFINQFSIDIEPLIKLKNVKILFSCIDLLSEEQVNATLENFANYCHHESVESVKFLMTFWGIIPFTILFKILKNLLPTKIFADIKFLDAVLENVNSDFGNLEKEDFIVFISQREADLKNSEEERDLYAKIIKRINSQLTSDLKAELRTLKIAEIKVESDIDLCRNKVSTIIGIKGADYEKDGEVNDMFFSLLNDTNQKKQLAIDVFEYYYEERSPYKRKGALEERFNNLMSELDSDYKRRLQHLARKYELNVKKSFWESLFGN